MVQYTLDPDKTVLTIDNLFPGTTYYYRVTAREVSLEDDSESGESNTYCGQFTTADTDRFVNIPNLENTRDIGGYVTADGRTTKYGMIIRGSELDGLVESDYFLTDREAAEPFGFVCDLDLRNDSIFTGSYQSMLGEKVSHKFHSAPSYGGIFDDASFSSLREIFNDMANPDNYPMYMHCTYGADRTGTIVFMLQGILGVSEEDMVKEYALTGFSRKSITTDGVNPIFGGLEGTGGDTINEKIVNYLVDVVGVPTEDIESIREILLEG